MKYPQVFYKPLFSLAAASKEVTAGNNLAVITLLSRFLDDFWTRDSEMMAVALFGGGAAAPNTPAMNGGLIAWGTARLGQCVILVELISCLRDLRTTSATVSARISR